MVPVPVPCPCPCPCPCVVWTVHLKIHKPIVPCPIPCPVPVPGPVQCEWAITPYRIPINEWLWFDYGYMKIPDIEYVGNNEIHQVLFFSLFRLLLVMNQQFSNSNSRWNWMFLINALFTCPFSSRGLLEQLVVSEFTSAFTSRTACWARNLIIYISHLNNSQFKWNSRDCCAWWTADPHINPVYKLFSSVDQRLLLEI